MDRRTFIGRVAGGLLAAPLAACAQQAGKVYRIGILESIPAARNAANLDALRKGLRDLGYVEGRNLVIEYRSADGRAERFPDLASELVRLKVDLIVTRGTPAARAAKNATGTIPVVMATMGDPHAIVASFAHPGANITGVTTYSTELIGKRIELLKELVPSLSRVALLHVYRGHSTDTVLTQDARKSFGIRELEKAQGLKVLCSLPYFAWAVFIIDTRMYCAHSPVI